MKGAKKHTTQKHMELIERLLLKHSDENDTVLDCFLGNDTTAVACKKNNRDCIDCKIDEHYFNIAKERIEEINEKMAFNNQP